MWRLSFISWKIGSDGENGSLEITLSYRLVIMAHVLSLVCGSDTVSLVASGCTLNNFLPRAGAPNAESVTDTIAVTLSAATPPFVRSKKRSIENYFGLARRRQQWRSGDKVYLQFQLSTEGAGATYRAEVLDGRIDYVEDSIQESAINYMECVIYVTRRPYWEGPETALELTNSSGIFAVTGLTIYNHDDATAGHDNYALITESQVSGTLPMPLKIEIKNLGTRQIKNVHICLDTLTDSAQNLSPTVEGEDGVGNVGGSYSGGLAKSFTVNTTYTLAKTITSAMLGYIAGRSMKVLGKFTFSGTVYAKISLSVASVTVIRSPEVKLNSQDYFQDLGTLPMPPGFDSSSWADASLVIEFRSTASVSMTCDFLQLFFADAGCYRYLTSVANSLMSIDVNDTILDDGIDDAAYINSASFIVGKLPVIARRGSPIMIQSHSGFQKLRFLIDGSSTSVDWTFSVRVWYRPRVSLPV